MKEAAEELLVSEEWFAAVEDVVGELVEVGGTAVGEGIGLEPTPEVFDGVQFGGISRQEFEMQPRMASHELSYFGAAMGWQAVPHEDDVTGQLPQELLEKFDCPVLVKGLVGMQSQQETQAMAARADRHGTDRRNVLVAAARVMKNRRLAGDGPSPSHQRIQEKAGFVLEHEVGRQSRGLFLIRRKSLRTQVAMAASSRSRARRCGFWGVKPSLRNRRGR